MNSPCKDCASRMVGCHSVCLKYADYRAKREELDSQRKDRAETYSYRTQLFAGIKHKQHRSRRI